MIDISFPPRLLVHYAPGVLAVLRRDRCPDWGTKTCFYHHTCDSGRILTVVGIHGLEPSEVSWVLSRSWLTSRPAVDVVGEEAMV